MARGDDDSTTPIPPTDDPDPKKQTEKIRELRFISAGRIDVQHGLSIPTWISTSEFSYPQVERASAPLTPSDQAKYFDSWGKIGYPGGVNI